MLEPNGPSIEEIAGGELHKYVNECIDQNLHEDQEETQDILYLSVKKYIEENPMKDRNIYYRFNNEEYYQYRLFSEIIDYRCATFNFKQQNYSWLSWNYADHNTLKALQK